MRRLVVIDGPGGPHPSAYLGPLRERYELWAGYLAMEPPAARERRRLSFAGVREVVAIEDARTVEDVTNTLIARSGADGVLAMSERVVHDAQRAAWSNGLIANTPPVIESLRDKSLQRRRLRDAGVPVPNWCELLDEAACARAVETLRFPVVLKPTVGMGSIATFHVKEKEDLIARWRHAHELARTDVRIAHLAPPLMAEEELVGDPRASLPGLSDYLSVESLVVDGEIRVIAVTEKLPLEAPFRENGHLMPSDRDDSELDDLRNVAVAANRALGVRTGATHTEIKLTSNGPRILEVNGRPGGGTCQMLGIAGGYDLVGALAGMATGDRPSWEPRWTGAACDLTLQAPLGRHTVLEAPAKAEVARHPFVRAVPFVAPPGSTFDSDHGTAAQIVRVQGGAPKLDDLIALADWIRSRFKFRAEHRMTASSERTV